MQQAGTAMSVNEIEDALDEISRSAASLAPKEQTDLYRNFLTAANKLPEADEQRRAYDKLLRVLLADSMSLITSRPLLQEFVKTLPPNLPDETAESLLNLCLEKLKTRTISCENEVTMIREKLADIYERGGAWARAAIALKGIPLESSQRAVENEFKLEIYLRIARLYLEDGNAMEADTFVKRAAMLVPDTQDETKKIYYQVSLARVHDARKKFAEAAQAFYDLSRRPAVPVVEQQQCLEHAVNATLVAPVGPMRDRTLAVLMKDSRVTAKLMPQYYPFLYKMFNGVLIKPEEVVQQKLAEKLQAHQSQIPGADGFTILQRAIQEHNIKCLINLFTSISFAMAAKILGVDEKTAETTVCNMVMEKRLQAHVDQQRRIIIFGEMSDRDLWNGSIESVLTDINDAYQEICQLHPDFVQQTLQGKIPT